MVVEERIILWILPMLEVNKQELKRSGYSCWRSKVEGPSKEALGWCKGKGEQGARRNQKENSQVFGEVNRASDKAEVVVGFC